MENSVLTSKRLSKISLYPVNFQSMKCSWAFTANIENYSLFSCLLMLKAWDGSVCRPFKVDSIKVLIFEELKY